MFDTLAKILIGAASTLSPSQRLRAMQQLRVWEGGAFLASKWFALFGACLVVALTIILLVYRKYRMEKDQQRQERDFNDNCERYGLNQDEVCIFAGIADRCGLKSKSLVFNISEAFDRGASSLMQEFFESGLGIEERKQLNARINNIKEKLGFKKRNHSYGIRSAHGKGLSSRQIPVGKKILIRPASKPAYSRIEAEVLANNEVELCVRAENNVVTSPGEMWNVHYHSGAAVWEFNVIVLSCEGGDLIFNQTENVRFLNRRRFLRVKVDKPALIAHFPPVSKEFTRTRIGMAPKFYQGRVEELSGPGLKLTCRAEFRSGERVIVVFKLREGKLVEDIAEVRGVEEDNGRWRIGLELVGLNDNCVDELVRETNNTAITSALEPSVTEHALAFAEGEANG